MNVFEADYAIGYDALYREKDYRAECSLIERAISASTNAKPKLILDVGCGTGEHAIELAQRGYSVTGVDQSSSMIQLAREKANARLADALRLDFVQGDARSFTASHANFDAAVMMFAVIGYLPTNDDVIQALSNIALHLKPGAVFVCDFWWGPAVLTQRPGERVRVVPTESGKLLRATRTTLDTLKCTADVHFDIFHLPDGAQAVQTSETHRMRYFFGPEMELLMRNAGFKLERLGQFPGLDEPPTDASWNAIAVARKV